MGDAAGEAAQALHLLRLEELRLQLGVVGDVDVRAEQRHLRAALVEQHRRMRQHVAVGAVLVPAAVLDLEVRRLAAQVLADGGDGAVDVVGMDAAAPRLEVRRDLVVLVAELSLPLRRVVDRVRHEAPLPEPDVAGADRALEPHLRLAEGGRRPRPLGFAAADVHGEADVHGHLVEQPHLVRVEPRGVGRAQDEHAADRVVARAQREARHGVVAVRGGERRQRRAVGEAASPAPPPLAMTSRPSARARRRGAGGERRIGDRGPQRLAVRRARPPRRRSSAAPPACPVSARPRRRRSRPARPRCGRCARTPSTGSARGR